MIGPKTAGNGRSWPRRDEEPIYRVVVERSSLL
jgi:hypothetical protein